MDDVGWGDFGAYGGGAAVGAPTPHSIARPRRACGSPPATPSRLAPLARHAVDRTAAASPWPASPRCTASPADCRARSRLRSCSATAATPRRLSEVACVA
jgi:arylsulfatase